MEKITHILVHYAEIGLKGQNRAYFERKLKDNIKLQARTFCPGALEKIERLQGRLLLTVSQEQPDYAVALTSVLKNVPGIAYFAPAMTTEPDLNGITDDVINLVQSLKPSSFRITARKTYSPFPHSKQHLHNVIGARINETFGWPVNLTTPDLNIHIDFVRSQVFIYLNKIPGIGGLPIGSSAPGVVMLSGGIDSPVAAFYALKRGMVLTYLHFHSVPHVSPASIDKVKRMAGVLTKFQPRAMLYLIEFAPIQNEIFAQCDPKYLVLLYRRFMVRIANAIAIDRHARALITGESLGQVASQTIENITVVNEISELPILRPVIGFDKQEIITVAKQIGTFDISVEPHQDCCTLFVPDHPATKARSIDLAREESKLAIDSLIQKAIESAEIVKL
ncbi:MAG: tRNA uracil 4-sulfurtransferase ThiI [Fidelibacterota bacterium]